MSTTSQRVPAEMPMPQQSTAPKFKGHWSEVTDFLCQCDQLFTHYNVETDADKCRFMHSYCDRPTREIIEGLPSYILPDWAKLKVWVLKIFDAERATQKFTIFDLHSFILRSCSQPLSSLDMFRDYMRQYMRVAGWLLGQKKIDKVEYNRCFWLGIDTSIRPSIEAKMNLRNSELDPSAPFDFDDIVTAAEMIFKRDRFDFGVFDKPKQVPSDSVYPRDDQEFTMDNLKKLLKSVIPSNKPTERLVLDPVQSRIVYDNLEKEGEKAQKADEVESLIKQMSRLTIQDPNYGVFYFRIRKLDPDIGKLLTPPAYVNVPRASSTSASSPSNSTVPARTQSFLNDLICFGCLQKGHTMPRCASLADLANQGVIARNDSGKWIMKDGRVIFRNPDESIVDAAKRLATPVISTNLATIHVVSEESDEEEDIAFTANQESAQVLAANRNEKSTRSIRKEVFDSVTVPTTDQLKAKRIAEAKEKAKKVPEADQTRPNPVNPPRQPINPPRQPVIIPPTVNRPKVPTPVFDPSDDDHIMEDITTPPSKTAVKKTTAPASRSSAVARHVDPFLVLNKVLNTELTLLVRELLGVSKEVSSRLTDLLKVTKSVETSANSAVNTFSEPTSDLTSDSTSDLPLDNPVFMLRAQSPLIQVLVTCNGKSLMAIIDSGATQNICSARCWKERINLPMDNKESVKMRDVHGNTSQMLGIVRNVPLSFGSVTTWANLFVSDQVHFDLLLGRPWFRDNLVNLKERKEGTYVSFHDPEDPSRTLEFMATPDVGYAEGFVSASLMSSVDAHIITLDDSELSDPVHEHPAELDPIEEEEEDLLRERIGAQINPDLTNVEWRVIQMLIAEQHELEAHLETLRGLLQPSVRTQFPWGHDIFQSSYSMYIGGGMTETRHRYEDYFLFHANRQSSIRHVPQPHGAAFVRWFPQEGTWDSLNTALDPNAQQEENPPVSPIPTAPSVPMSTPVRSPHQSPVLSPSVELLPSSSIHIQAEAETVSVVIPSEPMADSIPPFSRSLFSGESTLLHEERLGEDPTTSTHIDHLLPTHSNIPDLTITKDNGELIEDGEDAPPGLLLDTEPATVNTGRCQACINFDHSRMICQKMSRSQVIENDGNTGDALLMADDGQGYLGFQQSSPLSLSYPTSKSSSTFSSMEKATQAEEEADRAISPKLTEDAPLPLIEDFSQLTFAPKSDSSDTTQVVEDNIGWGVPVDQGYEEVMHNGDWYMAMAEWEAMNNTFTPANIEPWNYYSTGQDQENTVDYDMEEETGEGEEEMDAGTF